MKVGSYLAVLILTSMLGGYLIEYVLSEQFNNFRVVSDRYSENRLWLRDYERIISDSNQYLISSDLVIGSGETYLASGAKTKGRLIVLGLDELQVRNQLLRSSENIQKLSQAATQINQYLGEAELIGGQAGAEQLSDILAKYDPIAFELSSTMESLRSSAAALLVAEGEWLEELRRESEVVKLYTRIAFSVLLLMLWYWANRKISMPLRELRNMAQASEIGEHFDGVDRGPREIRQLSHSMKEMTNSLSYQATHDPLTQLLNRRAFDRSLLGYARGAAIGHSTHALCFIDLDRFKTINDTCGHSAGDELLKHVADVIVKSVRNSDVVARLGGDEFAILLSGCDISAGVEICNKVRVAIRELKYVRDDQVFRISASIGVTLIDGEGASIADLLNAADTACKFVKDSGRDSVHVFDVSDELLQKKRSEMSSIAQLSRAIDENRFVLFRQNIVPLGDNKSGNHYELLIRMRTIEGALISPDEFLPLAERYDLCKKLDQCVVNTAIDWLVAHPEELDALDMCSINLSGQSIGSSEFKDFIVEKLRESNFPGKKLCFEITETAAVTHLGTAIELIHELRHSGCQFALDDFGSGLSSFAYLKSLPVDFIKIDGAFVKDIVDDHINFATVKSITDIAKALGKKTVAEFVESDEIVDLLMEIGVDYAQGYHFGRPKLFIDPASATSTESNIGFASRTILASD